jgi:hypothetical protein
MHGQYENVIQHLCDILAQFYVNSLYYDYRNKKLLGVLRRSHTCGCLTQFNQILSLQFMYIHSII